VSNHDGQSIKLTRTTQQGVYDALPVTAYLFTPFLFVVQPNPIMVLVQIRDKAGNVHDHDRCPLEATQPDH
jgi:hypothetical protein